MNKLMILMMKIYFVIASNCPSIKLQTNPPVNLTEYAKHTWYIQQQQINGYQPESDLYCVTATYKFANNYKVPFFNGTVLSVYNYANHLKINGNHTNNNTVLCARQINSSSPEKLLVAPCFLPNIFGGPYWIVYAGPDPSNYQYAIVSGGQPTLRINNNTCTTKLTGVINTGLWIFSRNRTLDYNTTTFLRNILRKRGISTDKLLNVSQHGCNYTGSFIK